MNTQQINKLNKQVRKTNTAFMVASPAEKRVMIAKDALERLKSKKIIASSGEFVEFGSWETKFAEDYFGSDKWFKQYKGKEFQKILPKLEECNVCALGGLFTSQVRLANNCKVTSEELEYSALDMTDRMKQMKYFSRKQRALIELAFEGGNGYFSWDAHNADQDPETYGVSEDEYEAAVAFYNKYHDYDKSDEDQDKERLIDILENIIKNNGTFKLDLNVECETEKELVAA